MRFSLEKDGRGVLGGRMNCCLQSWDTCLLMIIRVSAGVFLVFTKKSLLQLCVFAQTWEWKRASFPKMSDCSCEILFSCTTTCYHMIQDPHLPRFNQIISGSRFLNQFCSGFLALRCHLTKEPPTVTKDVTWMEVFHNANGSKQQEQGGESHWLPASFSSVVTVICLYLQTSRDQPLLIRQHINYMQEEMDELHLLLFTDAVTVCTSDQIKLLNY